MRTKTLLCAAALAAGVATSMAQSNVYSLNVVGYVNVTVGDNQFAMIANPLNTTNNTIGSVIPVASDGAQFYKYNGGYTTYTYDGLCPCWTPDGLATLNPGEGGFFHQASGGGPFTNTFVGEVLQGSLTNPVPINVFAIRGSMEPVTGTLTGVLSFPGEDGDQAYIYSGGYSTYTYDGLAPGWTPGDLNGPVLNVGQSFFIHKASTSTINKWIQNFTVN